MKKIIALSVIFASCNSRNSQMTELLNKQKEVKQEITVAENSETFFKEKAREAYKTNDSTIYKPLIDSQTYYYMRGRNLREVEKEIQFSIDSLSSMH